MFYFHSTADDVVSGVDLTGTIAVITGATGGLGLETARALAGAGADLVLPVRSTAPFAESADYRRIASLTDRIRVVEMDLGSLASVSAAVDAITSSVQRVDLLINNAGVMFTPELRTVDGLEFQFGVNHLGHFALTTGLMGLLRAAGGDGGARIVTLTSEAYRNFGVIDLADLDFRRRGYDPFEAYGQSKMANILMTVEAHRRLAADGITAVAVHPGTIVDTGLSRRMEPETMARLMRMSGDTFDRAKVKSIAQGAATTVYAATTDDLVGGTLLADCAPAVATQEATDPDRARRLWEVSEELLDQCR